MFYFILFFFVFGGGVDFFFRLCMDGSIHIYNRSPVDFFSDVWRFFAWFGILDESFCGFLLLVCLSCLSTYLPILIYSLFFIPSCLCEALLIWDFGLVRLGRWLGLVLVVGFALRCGPGRGLFVYFGALGLRLIGGLRMGCCAGSGFIDTLGGVV
ncbi:hypothetical protein F4861DRAFT_70897 [Xylaria intraflava]|nr:hypothetical protein F4861DRAFT_70897 [Xylaria intraflava]